MELGLRLAFFATEGTYHRNWRIKLTYSWAGQRSAMRVHDVMSELRFTARTGAFHIILASASRAACARLF